jgi:hypothetical protein
MKASKTRRPGATETFSVSVDPRTKKVLRALADRDFGGNLSALITDFAADARRRLIAGDYLSDHGIAPMTSKEAAEFQVELEVEAAAWKKRHRRRRVA